MASIPCSHKSKEGKLNLRSEENTKKTFVWCSPAEEIVLEDVVKTSASKTLPGKPLVLKVDTMDGKSYMFCFGTEALREAAKQFLAPSHLVKIILNDPVRFNPLRTLSSEEVQARANVLAGRSDIALLHATLVGGNLISEDDFWVTRDFYVAEEMCRMKQTCGVTPEALIEEGGVESFARIFTEYPEVFDLYVEHVPSQMAREEFWDLYKHSKYVLVTQRNVNRNGGYFQSTVTKRGKDDADKRERARLIFGNVDDFRLRYRRIMDEENRRMLRVSHDIDLPSTADDVLATSPIHGLSKEGWGTSLRDVHEEYLVSKSSKELVRSMRARGISVDRTAMREIHHAVKDDPVLSKLNRRSAAALTHTNDVELRMKRIREERWMDGDLDHEAEPAYLDLTLKRWDA